MWLIVQQWLILIKTVFGQLARQGIGGHFLTHCEPSFRTGKNLLRFEMRQETDYNSV